MTTEKVRCAWVPTIMNLALLIAVVTVTGQCTGIRTDDGWI